MALLAKSTIIYTLLTVILAIIYPFVEWRASLHQYKESKIDRDFNRQLYSVMHGAKHHDTSMDSIAIHKITPTHEQTIGFNLLDAQYSAILSNYIYLLNHDTFTHSNNPIISEPLSDAPHNFPRGFNLYYLQLRRENDVNVKWAVIGNNATDTLYVVLCGTDFMIDILIDISFSPFPLTYSPNDIQLSKSWNDLLHGNNFLVHGAISGSVQWLFNNITTALDVILRHHNHKKVALCGHSLGAGYATVVAMRMLTLFKTYTNIDIKLYTFGAPFVLSILDGDRFNHTAHPALVTLNKNAFNFVNRFDIIPRMLGEQFEVLYPKFLWHDELLLNQIKSFKPIGNYYILHDRNRILYGVHAQDEVISQILKIIPKALFSDRNDARTKLVLLIFRVLFGKKYEEYINYLLWISFSAQPLINDHSMDKYLSMIGDFTSQISFTSGEDERCLNYALKFDKCEQNTLQLQWRVTQYGQLQNLRSKECIYMDWKLDDLFEWSFTYHLRKTYECSTKVTRFKYVNALKMFKIVSDERMDDYDDMNGLCLGCNLYTMQLNAYECNQSLQHIQTVFHFNPHHIATKDGQVKDDEYSNLIIPQWSWFNLFDRFF